MTMRVLVLLACFAPLRADEVNPISKVLQMIGDLESKVIKEGEAAQKIYAEASEWCEDTARSLEFSIKTGKGEVATLKATIIDESATIETLTSKVDDLAAAIATSEADLAAATKIRKKEEEDFLAEQAELEEVIDTLGRATSIIARELQKGGASMLQMKNAKNIAQALTILVQASALDSADATKLTALVQNSQEDGDDDAGAPAAAVYESQSGDIVAVLENLKDKAEDQLAEARKKETTTRHNFELLKQSLDDEIKFANKDLAAAKKGIAKSTEAKAGAEGDLEMTSKALKADTAALADLHRDCMAKAQDFESTTASRGEELKALAEAKRVIKEATGGAEELSYGLAQVSFVQRSKLSSSTDLARFEAVRLVRDLAKKEHSTVLSQLATRMASMIRSSNGDDIFGKVKTLIKDMVARLEEEGAADATEKAFCDKELAETNEKKSDKSDEIAKLTTNIDGMAAKSAQLKEQVAALQKALAELAASQAEMTKLRQEEHAQFSADKPQMEEGIVGIQAALKILRDYYASDKGHAAAEGAGAGIVGLLEVCESDFTKGLADMETTEEAAQSAYDTESKENEIEKATKEQDVKYKDQESTSLDKAISEATSDRDGVQAELDAVLEYLKSLQERCVAKAETYADKKAHRESEIAGLKQALEILSDQASLIQKKSSRQLRRHGAQ